MASSKDPLNLGELDPDIINANIAAKGSKTKAPSELELQKEARLAEKEKRMSSNLKKPTPEVLPPAPPPPQLDRSMLLDKIAAYRERFPFLKKRNNVSVKSTVDEILDELHYCELQLGSQQGSSLNLSSTVLTGAMYGIEKVTMEYWNPLGLNLVGLSTVAQQNMHEFQPILDELMIKHNAGTYTSPEWRLALVIGATVLTVNAANSNPEMARAVKSMNAAVNKPGGTADL